MSLMNDFIGAGMREKFQYQFLSILKFYKKINDYTFV